MDRLPPQTIVVRDEKESNTAVKLLLFALVIVVFFIVLYYLKSDKPVPVVTDADRNVSWNINDLNPDYNTTYVKTVNDDELVKIVDDIYK